MERICFAQEAQVPGSQRAMGATRGSSVGQEAEAGGAKQGQGPSCGFHGKEGVRQGKRV